MRKELDKQLDEMERNNIIEESTSPWHSPVVLVKKRNGSIRVCVDYRALNRITEPMSAVIPTMTDIFDTLADSKPELFSSLDLTSGFWQVPLDPTTKHKSAFITHKGVYEFNRLPFGMMNSPLTFQCLMTKVLKDLNFKIALVYIDDILIFSKNFEDHLNHLQQVFSNLREANLKLNPEKCKFATRTIKYLGHVISKDGIRVNPENTEKVKDFSRPTTAKQVKSFLGMANYYRKFVKDYAHIAAPLTKLLKKDQRFKWTSECDIAFQNLKDRLTSAPILSFPHLDKPFILATDSSEFFKWIYFKPDSKWIRTCDCLWSELADHLGSIDIPKEYSEVTFIYKGENEDAVISSLQTVTINDIQLTNLAEEQENCRDFADIIKYKQTGRVPQNPELARAVVAESYNFELEDGILKHFYSKRCKKVPKDERLVKQIAVPRNLRDSILKAYHDCILGGGHQGFERRTYAAIRNKYFWPSMYSDINQYVKTCEVCQQSKRAFNSKPPPLQPQPTNDIFGRWHMDILSGLPTTKDKYKHVLLVVDSYSKWCEAFPLRSEEAETSRKIAAKNIKQAQERYKQQYDKKSKEPEFQPAQRVWLYCTKVPVGKAPKLHRKWSGPYYITRIGPNSTYKLRNCATNKEVVSMVNAQRMKPYYDPKDRPTNLPDEFQNDNEELNPEEIQDDNIIDNDQLLPNNRQQPVPPINNNGINRQQPPIPVINNNRPTQNQQQLPVDRINNRQQKINNQHKIVKQIREVQALQEIQP
ncbi:Hypothetical predicted protein [Mytilus galloprovincialis]|uniref:Reverse transcriptase domain-containing protein n=1 Tax=Mytilus galloprovincialis TaxID=29158 RepID=A0A8B6GGW9_MYTGA|nr:Hypothetical predicted protein [Mytilus galloprovincialis]